MDKEFVTKSPKETAAVAKSLAKDIINNLDEGPAVIGLVGNLGAGKTTFIKSFIGSLGVKKRITSPTFVVVRSYRIPARRGLNRVFHVDAYRVNSEDLVRLGVSKAIKTPGNIVVVEWADKVKSILPKDTIWVMFMYGEKESERNISFNRL